MGTLLQKRKKIPQLGSISSTCLRPTFTRTEPKSVKKAAHRQKRISSNFYLQLLRQQLCSLRQPANARKSIVNFWRSTFYLGSCCIYVFMHSKHLFFLDSINLYSFQSFLKDLKSEKSLMSNIHATKNFLVL
jgi:hypothetical protein